MLKETQERTRVEAHLFKLPAVFLSTSIYLLLDWLCSGYSQQQH